MIQSKLLLNEDIYNVKFIHGNFSFQLLIYLDVLLKIPDHATVGNWVYQQFLDVLNILDQDLTQH